VQLRTISGLWRRLSVFESVLLDHLIDRGLELIDSSGADLNRGSGRAKIILDPVLGFVVFFLGTSVVRTMLIDFMTQSGEWQGTTHDEWLIDRGCAG